MGKSILHLAGDDRVELILANKVVVVKIRADDQLMQFCLAHVLS